jgi:hypothetical protein
VERYLAELHKLRVAIVTIDLAAHGRLLNDIILKLQEYVNRPDRATLLELIALHGVEPLYK